MGKLCAEENWGVEEVRFNPSFELRFLSPQHWPHPSLEVVVGLQTALSEKYSTIVAYIRLCSITAK